MAMTKLRASSELADAPCSVGECLENAATMGSATVQVDPNTLAPPDFRVLTLGLPLCADHAYLLQGECQLLEFQSGL